jgi:hypothetical protein
MYLPYQGDGPADDRFYMNRARVLRELAAEADPLIKGRLLRLADNCDDITTTQTARDQTSKRPAQSAHVDRREN